MIHKNAVGKIDPHRLAPVRGPSTELEAHIDSCKFDDLHEYAAKVRAIKKEPNFEYQLYKSVPPPPKEILNGTLTINISKLYNCI